MMPQCNLAQRTSLKLLCLSLMGLWVAWGCDSNQSKKSMSDRPANETLSLESNNGPVTMRIRLWPKEPRLSDIVELDIEVDAEADVVIRPPVFGQAVGDFLVRDYSERSPNKFNDKDKPVQRSFHYQLEPVHSGVHLIRSIAIEFVNNGENTDKLGESNWIESEPIEVKISSELSDQVPDLADLEPMVAPQSIQDGSRWWWLGAGLLAVAALGAYFLKRRQKDYSTQTLQLSAEQIAHAQLSTLLAEELPARGMFKDFYLRLTGIVRNYIEGITGLRAPEQTTEEFLREMGATEVFSSVESNRLKEFLEAADMVKYAGQTPDSLQIDTSILRAKEFIDLKPRVQEKNPSELQANSEFVAKPSRGESS